MVVVGSGEAWAKVGESLEACSGRAGACLTLGAQRGGGSGSGLGLPAPASSSSSSTDKSKVNVPAEGGCRAGGEGTRGWLLVGPRGGSGPVWGPNLSVSVRGLGYWGPGPLATAGRERKGAVREGPRAWGSWAGWSKPKVAAV